MEAYPAEVPTGVGVLTASVDVQGDRIELAVRGWGEYEESWLILHERIWGDPEHRDVWQALEHQLTRPYECVSGQTTRIRACAIDAQFLTDTVFDFVRGKETRGVYAVHGSDSRLKDPMTRLRRPNRQRVKPWTVDSTHFKTILLRRLAMTSSSEHFGGPGFMHFCTGLDAEYFAQLKSEQRTKVRSGRRFRWVIKQVRDRNEAIDLEYLNIVALHALPSAVRDRLADLARELALPVDTEPDDSGPPTKQSSKRRGWIEPRRGSWGTSW